MRVLELHPWRVSYREAVGIQNSLHERLRLEPLAPFSFDGQGLTHPRRFGLACHAGLLLARRQPQSTRRCSRQRLMAA